MNNPAKPSAIDNSLKCGGCGALLHFAPGTNSLKCDYCGQQNTIVNGGESAITAVDYDEFTAGIDTKKQSETFKVVNCTSCGSQSILDEFVTSDRCSFCTAPLVLDLKSGQQYVQPHYILPFKITKEQGIKFFQDWLRNLWWAPNDLAGKVSGGSLPLNGVYLPNWAFDTNTTTAYTGARGDHYYTTETYTETVDGKSQTRTREVRHTRWSGVVGTVYVDFHDVLVPASKSLPEQTLTRLEPWKLDELTQFDGRYMSGFRSETYQVDPKQGFIKAVAIMADEIDSAVRQDIGGDEQRVDGKNTDYRNKKIKYLMLPVWVSAYNYNNKIYQFTINACTGEVIGKRPYSALKITLAILFVIALIITGVFLYQSTQHQ